MTYVLLTTEIAVGIPDAVLNPGELQGMARDKLLEGALGRVDNRLVYGMIGDIFDLAAAYCVAVATGNVFNRTAHQTMDACLDLNGVQFDWAAEQIGDLIRDVAQGCVDEQTLADWLRAHAA